MLPFACPLQVLQLVDGECQLAVNACFIAKDLIKVPAQKVD